MAVARRNILIAGLGGFIAADPKAAEKFGPQKANIQLLQNNIARVGEAGFDCDTEDVDPNDAEDSLGRIKVRLESKEYDAFIIGFGLRGNKDFTDVFEKIVNLTVEVSPTTKFGFSTAPDGVFETVQRIFPEVK